MATVSWNNMTRALFADVMTVNGVYGLDNSQEGQVWIIYKSIAVPEDEGEDEDTSEDDGNYFPQPPPPTDFTTPVVYSVMVYYTPDFESTTPDIRGWVNQVLMLTNQGYANSGIPLSIKLHCLERADIPDRINKYSMLTSFMSMKGKNSQAILNSADAAVLLVNNLEVCGRAHSHSISVKETFCVVRKSCALHKFTFGHELAHARLRKDLTDRNNKKS